MHVLLPIQRSSTVNKQVTVRTRVSRHHNEPTKLRKLYSNHYTPKTNPNYCRLHLSQVHSSLFLVKRWAETTAGRGRDVRRRLGQLDCRTPPANVGGFAAALCLVLKHAVASPPVRHVYNPSNKWSGSTDLNLTRLDSSWIAVAINWYGRDYDGYTIVLSLDGGGFI